MTEITFAADIDKAALFRELTMLSRPVDPAAGRPQPVVPQPRSGGSPLPEDGPDAA